MMISNLQEVLVITDVDKDQYALGLKGSWIQVRTITRSQEQALLKFERRVL